MCGCGGDQNRERTNAAMCAACPALGRKMWGPGREHWVTQAVCTVDGRAFDLRGQRAAEWPCPKGWHADERGMVRWLGIRWRGVPYPLRVRLRRWGVEFKRGPLPECGCMDRVKAWTEGVGERVRRAWARGVACVVQPAPTWADD
jgi:hypothetical protein